MYFLSSGVKGLKPAKVYSFFVNFLSVMLDIHYAEII